MKIVEIKGSKLVLEDGTLIQCPPLFNPRRFIGVEVEEMEKITGSDIAGLKALWREDDV